MDTGDSRAQTEGIKAPVSSLLIYKYRHKPERQEMFMIPHGIKRVSSDKYDDELQFGEEEKPKKVYTILQEPRSEFAHSKLRYAIMLYNTSTWTIFILTTLFISYIIDTCLYTFNETKKTSFWLVVLVVSMNFIFTLDVVIVCGLKFSKQLRKTLNLVEPNTNRVIIDVLLAVPYSILYLIKGNVDTLRFDIIAPIVSTLRIYRLILYFCNRSSQAGSNQWSTFLFQYLILFVLSVHTWTCIWYLFAYKDFDIHKSRSSWSVSAVYLPTENTFAWYFVCAYWSVMFLTTNALGDLYPVTTTERLMASISIIIGFLLTTLVFVGSLTSQFITITTRRAKYVRHLKKIMNHLHLINMDKNTTKRIIRYYEDLWYQKSGVFKPKFLTLLPYPLQMEICYDLNAVPLYSSLLFRKLPEAFLRRLSIDMTHQFYLPGDIVYDHNQNKTFMICITNGVIELLSDEDDDSPMISFAKGTCFGEIALAYNIPARCTVKAATYVECQVLEKTAFIKLMITYPDLYTTIREEIQKRIDRSHCRKQTQGSSDYISLNIYASKDRKKSSIKCLKDKLRYIQGKLEVDPLTKEDHLDENCLDLYILSEHIKKKNSNFTCLSENFPWILECECNLVKYWEIHMLIIVTYICLFYPYYIGYKRHFPGGYFFYIDIVITLSLILNILISSVTAVKTKKKYIKTFSEILTYRMNTLGFYLDMVVLIPFEYIVTIHTRVNYLDDYRDHLFYLCKGIKLCLVWRLSSFFENLEKKLLTNTLIVKITKYCIYISLLCYWCGIILYMESCFVKRCSEDSWFANAMNTEDNWKKANYKIKYPIVASIYFATAIILSVGYGDFKPGDMYDMCLIAFLSLYGVLLTGYCISEFSALVTHWSRTKTAFLEVILTIDKFMLENNMSPAIKSRIMAFYELQWQYNSGVELTDQSWLKKTVVPPELRKKVLHQARFKALTSIRFFQVKNKAYIHTLTEMARDIILPPGEIVYYGGTISRELYIIESGYCLVTSQDLRESHKERVVGPGNHMGLLVLLYGVPAGSTVITLTHCKLICICHSAYTSALSLFPDMREHDNILNKEEIKCIEMEAKAQNIGTHYSKHFDRLKDKSQRTRITGFLQEFFDGSFIDVLDSYKAKKESYFKSYKQFHVLNTIAPYILLPFAIKPCGIFLKTWAMLRVASSFVLCIVIPINVAMAPACGIFNIIILVLETICFIDMYLMLHVAYYGPKNQLIYHPYLTAKNYITGPFVCDFLTCFPWYVLLKIFSPNHNEDHADEEHLQNAHSYHCIVRMVNVLQIYKVYVAFATESISAMKRAYFMSVVQFFLLTVFFLNLYTSMLITLSCRYLVGKNPEHFARKVANLSHHRAFIGTNFHPDGNVICEQDSWIDTTKISNSKYLSPRQVYLAGYYWSATSFSGAGFGDITAQDTTHMLLSICINIHGVLFFGYVYARIASLKAMADQVVTQFQENLKHLELFLNRENVPFGLKRNIVDYWKYQWKRTGGWSHQSILGKLHANLNEDAVLYMYEKTLREIPLFENVEYSFFRAFAKKLKEQYFQKGYMIMRSNEVITEMFIIYRGKVDIMSETNEVEACMGPGGIFGNIRGAAKYLSMSNVTASRNIDLLCIGGPEFYALLKSYPTVMRKVKFSVDSAHKDYVLPTIVSEKASLELETMSQLSAYNVYNSDDDEDDQTQSPDRSIAESHGSKSITSAGNIDYISAPYLFFMPHRWFRSSIIPDCKLVTFMDHLMLFLSYVDFMLLIYQMAFYSVPHFFHICIAFDVISLYKLFLDVHTGYMNRYGDYVLDPRKVRKMYFSKVLLRRRDFLANFPLCYIAYALDLKPTVQLIFFSYLRTPQLFRITYLFTFRTHRKVNIGTANLMVKLTTIAIWASILAHVNACLFFKLSCLTPLHCVSANWMSKRQLDLKTRYLEADYFALYISALWYMINLLTIAGMGDVTSQNDFELIETIIGIIIIKFCTGLLISEMSGMIMAHTSSLIQYDHGINELRDGLRDMDLSEHQMNKMWDYVRELWNRQQGRQMPELIYSLPFRLRCQVMQAVYGGHIRESMIFSKTDDDFRRMLSMWMKHCVFFPGNYIVQCGDCDQCIYFIHRGEVEVLTVHPNLTESIYDILGPEDSFGVAQGLFVGVAHHFSFRARTVVDIVFLKLDQWKYLLDFYPNSAKIVKRKVENVYLAI